MQILRDVAEEVQPSLRSGEASAIFWEYWNGSQWSALRVSDNSRGLRERGFLGFFGPDTISPAPSSDRAPTGSERDRPVLPREMRATTRN
jgi:hypothetical protein